MDLAAQLEAWRGRRVWLLGIGNPERGDDGFGVLLVRSLAPRVPAHRRERLVEAGTCPERFVGRAVQAGAEELVLADAVDFGRRPGELLLAGTAALLARPVGTAAHRVPLAVLARYAEGLGARAWLLGVQPGSLAAGPALSAEVARTLEALVRLLGRALGAREPGAGARAPATLDGVER